MRRWTVLVSLLLSVSVFADAVEEVRQAEIAFSRAFADRDKEKFFSYVAEDATFLSGGTTSQGKQQVIERWSRFFAGPEAPFSWTPERVSVAANGTLGLSTGPVHAPDGTHVGDYISTWQKQNDGTWRIVFDSTGPGPAPQPEALPPREDGFVITEDGARLYFRKVGRGPHTIIAPLDFVLHPFLRQLSDRATIITYDLRNRGRSSRVEKLDSLSIEQDVRDLEAVRRHFKAEKFIPVGFSYLGKMVMLYAAAHPDRVTRIIQLGPSPNEPLAERPKQAGRNFGASEADVKQWEQLREAGALKTAPREFCLAQFNVLRFYLTGTKAGAGRFDVAGNCEHENEWPVHLNPHFAALAGSIDNVRLSADELKKIAVPVLVIHGTRDRNVPVEAGRDWSAKLSNSRLIEVEGAAHVLWLDEPAIVFAALRNFLRE